MRPWKLFVLPALAALGFGYSCSCAHAASAPAAFTITVVNAAGKPIPGATVALTAGLESFGGPEATTGANGVAQISPPGAVTSHGAKFAVYAESYGLGNAAVRVGETSSTAVLGPAASVSGTVVDASGKPVGGANVTVLEAGTESLGYSYVGGSALRQQFSASTNKAGRYTIPDLPRGAFVLAMLDDPRYARAEAPGAVSSVLPPMQAVPACTINGRVMHADGGPASGVVVYARPTTGPGFGWIAKTGIDGSYSLKEMPAGVYTIGVRPSVDVVTSEASLPGWAPASVAGVQVRAGAPSSQRAPTIVVPRAAELSGIVTDAATGRPIGGVLVMAQPEQNPELSQSALTGPDGRYAIALAAGRYRVNVQAAPVGYFCPAQPNEICVALGEPAQYSVALKMCTVLHGSVVDSAGKPIPNVILWLAGPPNAGGNELIQMQADAVGAFLSPALSPGTFSLTVEDPWQVVSPRSMSVQHSGDIRVVLRRAPAHTLAGRVVDPNDRPIAGVAVDFDIQFGFGNGGQTGRFEQCTTGKDGRFAICDLTADDTYVHAQFAKPGYVRVDGGEVTGRKGTFEIVTPVLAPTNCSVAGIVRSETGAAAAGAWVVARDSGSAFPLRADGAGRFTLSGLTAGPVDILAARGDQVGSAFASASAEHIRRCIVTLGDADPPAPASDYSAAAKVLTIAQKPATSSGESMTPSDSLAPLGFYGPELALSAMSAYGPPDDFALYEIAMCRIVVDPVGGAQWALANAASIGDDTLRQSCLLNAGIAAAPYDRALALQLYDAAAHPALQATSDARQRNDLECRCALAAALNLPDAEQQIAACMAAAEKADLTQKDPRISNVAWFLGILAHGDVRRAATEADGLTGMVQSLARASILAGSVYGGSDAVETAYRIVPFNPGAWVSDDNTMQNEGQSLIVLGRQDPTQLVHIAQQAAGAMPGATILVADADAAPMPEAADLYRKAFAAQSGSQTQFCSPAMVAGRAWLRDRDLGMALFHQARALIGHEYESGMVPPNATDFAYYYAWVDPAEARLTIEHQFAVDSKSQHSSFRIHADALAMTEIDTERAEHMAEAIPDEELRVHAFEEIANYLMASVPERRAIPFDQWSTAMILYPCFPVPPN